MASIIKASINLSNVPKDKIITGKKGKYLPITITVNDDLDQFGNQGPICVDQSKEERDSKEAKTYLGNVKVYGQMVKMWMLLLETRLRHLLLKQKLKPKR